MISHSLNPSTFLIRHNCLRLAAFCCERLVLKLRTRELIFVTIDSALNKLQYVIENLKLLTISCIVFIIKLESDFTTNLSGFIKSCSHHFKISLPDIMKNEHMMFDLMPQNLCSMILFTEIIELVLSLPQFEHTCKGIDKNYLIGNCFNTYIEDFKQKSSFDICFLSLINLADSVKNQHRILNDSFILFRMLDINVLTNIVNMQNSHSLIDSDFPMQMD